MKKTILFIAGCTVGLLGLSLASVTYAKEKTAITNAKEVAISALTTALNASSKAEMIAEEVPIDAKAAIEKKLLSEIKIEKPETDPAASQVFRTPIYKMIYKVRQLLGYVSVIDGAALSLKSPGSSAVLSGYLKLIRGDFVLDSEEKAKLLGKAFQSVFPYKRSDGGKFIQPVKLDKGWLLIRDEFFKNHSGLIFTTDEKKKIILIEYVLKINPEDYSYEAPTDISY